MNVVLNDANCPYYQLYGPPPSYETVIAQTRGKSIGSPTSPARAAESSSVPQCFFYACNSPTRLVDSAGANQCHQGENASDAGVQPPPPPPFARYSQYCAANGAAIGGQSMCVPLEYPEGSTGIGGFAHSYPTSPQRPPGYPAVPLDTSGNIRSMESHAMLNVDAATGGYSGASWCPASDQSALKVHGRIVEGACGATTAMNAHPTSPKPEMNGNETRRNATTFRTMVIPDEDATPRRSLPRERTHYGGSLRLPRRSAAEAMVHRSDGFRRISFRDTSSSQRCAFGKARTALAGNTGRDNRRDNFDANSSQSNPSNNVILESFISEGARMPARDDARDAPPRAINPSTNLDPESKHKLDRSKSLD